MANTQNIVSGLSYTVETGEPIAFSYTQRSQYEKIETAASDGKLTDGKRAASLSFSDDAWHKAYRGYSRIVTFVLPSEKAVTGFSISMLQSNKAGLYLSDFIRLSVSENGTDWMNCYTIDNTNLLSSTETHIVTSKLERQTRYKANYIKVEFATSVSCFVDEIEVYGEDVDGTESGFIKDAVVEYKNAYSVGVEGAQEMALLYCGYEGTYDKRYALATVDQMKYYAGYVDKNGKITDTMFDSILYCPFQQNGASGNKIEKKVGAVTLKSDWLYYLDSMFDKTHNLSALEEALNQVMASTGKTDCKMQIYTAVLFPNISGTPFGDINGDGIDEYCRNYEEQLAIIEWFMEEFIARFSTMGYKNVIPGGFYWVQESLDASDILAEKELVQTVAALSHKRNVYFYWIPLLLGNGFNYVDELGFDCAMMQPNFNFLTYDLDGKKILYADEKMFTEVDEIIRKYGLGIEIEIHWNAINSDGTGPTQDEAIRHYYTYLDGGYTLGYMNGAAHSYYQNAGPGTFYDCGVSSDKKLRAIYDDTYAFVKSTYIPHMVTLSADSIETTVNTSVKGYISKEADGFTAAIGSVDFMVSAQPQHGTVTLDGQRFTYTPSEGFTGNDSFTVVAGNTYYSSAPLTVTITIAKDENATDSAVSAESVVPTDSSAPSVKSKKGLVGGMIAGVLAIAAVVAIIAVKKKRKK